MKQPIFLGIDVGSVSTNIAAITEDKKVLESMYLRTQGKPLMTVQKGLIELKCKLENKFWVKGVGTTGSGRQLSGLVVGADVIKNEITAHAVAATTLVPGAKTIIEIGGQDSKIIVLNNGVVTDFAMNTVCAAGTGSFLDQQASRLNLPVEEFGALALKAEAPVRIAGRCSVFAESDMIHKQQMGHTLEDIVAGLCQALVRNYLNNVGKGKEIKNQIVFQGGVAANLGIRKAFEEALNSKIVVPSFYNVMGAIGAALLAQEHIIYSGKETSFRGFQLIEAQYKTKSFECKGCPNLCEVIQLEGDEKILARWGDRCGKWNNSITA